MFSIANFVDAFGMTCFFFNSQLNAFETPICIQLKVKYCKAQVFQTTSHLACSNFLSFPSLMPIPKLEIKGKILVLNKESPFEENEDF